MPVRTEILLNHRFYISPETLVVAQKELPVSLTDYVPLRIFDIAFPAVLPVLVSLGGGAVAMSLGRPFGFMRRTDGEGRIISTQKTSGLVVAPSAHEDGWLATFETNNPLTELDTDLFSQGIGFYAAKVEDALRRPRVTASVDS